MDLLTGIIINLVSDILFWFILGIVVYFSYLLPSKKRFETFFGLNYDKKIRVYISNLWDPEVKTNQWGEIVAGQELKAAESINNLFAHTPSSFPELVKGLVDKLWLRGGADVEIKVSPQQFELPKEYS